MLTNIYASRVHRHRIVFFCARNQASLASMKIHVNSSTSNYIICFCRFRIAEILGYSDFEKRINVLGGLVLVAGILQIIFCYGTVSTFNYSAEKQVNTDMAANKPFFFVLYENNILISHQNRLML